MEEASLALFAGRDEPELCYPLWYAIRHIKFGKLMSAVANRRIPFSLLVEARGRVFAPPRFNPTKHLAEGDLSARDERTCAIVGRAKQIIYHNPMLHLSVAPNF